MTDTLAPSTPAAQVPAAAPATAAPDPMRPVPFRIRRVQSETHDTFTLVLTPPPTAPRFAFRPGQFNMLYAFGAGEVPISLSGAPGPGREVIHTIRAVGPVTRELQRLKAGDTVGVRGPFGTAWPVDEIEGRDVATGSPLRTVESDAICAEMSACVRAVVERLPVGQRIALTLSELEGQSDAEIAALLGVSVGCVKIRLHRARARLRKELASSCRLFRDARNEIACEPIAPAGTAHRWVSLGPYPFAPPDRLGKRQEATQCQNNVATSEAELT